ncbi:MAG: hypothetical protein M3Q77_04340 [Thermoproteota archaeon]|nr:hypothetical protein [Thermoproteota archaeon]
MYSPIFMKNTKKSFIVALSATMVFAIISLNIGSVQSQSDNSMSELDSFFSGPANSTSGLSSSIFNIPDVNGTFINPDTGFKITFPSNWTGKQISFVQDLVMVSPEGIDTESTTEPEATMMVNTITQEYYDMLSETMGSNLSNESSEDGLSNQTDNLFVQDNESCQPQTAPSIVTINGAIAEESMYNCTIAGSAYTTKAYAFATSDNDLIVITFTGNASNFDKYLPEFENSVKTVEISNPVDITKSELYNNYKEMMLENTD